MNRLQTYLLFVKFQRISAEFCKRFTNTMVFFLVFERHFLTVKSRLPRSLTYFMNICQKRRRTHLRKQKKLHPEGQSFHMLRGTKVSTAERPATPQ